MHMQIMNRKSKRDLAALSSIRPRQTQRDLLFRNRRFAQHKGQIEWQRVEDEKEDQHEQRGTIVDEAISHASARCAFRVELKHAVHALAQLVHAKRHVRFHAVASKWGA